MKKIIIAILVSVCVAALVPAAFAADTDNCRPLCAPTLRTGVAFDAGPTHYEFSRPATFLGIRHMDLKLPSVARPYIALEVPFYVTDRLTITAIGEWSFTAADCWGVSDHYTDNAGTPLVYRYWDTDGTAHWVSAELLASYSLIKDRPVVKDLSVIAGLHWDYFYMNLDNPHNGILSATTDYFGARTEYLAPIFGLSTTIAGFKHGIWGGDMHLRAMAGPIVWGNEHYKESINTLDYLVVRGDFWRGYIVKVFADVTILSGEITPWMEGSLTLFGQYTRTEMNGTVQMKDWRFTTTYPRAFYFKGHSDVLVFGLGATLKFDICEPVPAPVPAPAPVIEPKLEPMSFN
jgi:hypothetical protein